MMFSVIIPVYNSENTICRCLDSLLGQEHDDVEFLVINDGSSDKSDEILTKYSSNNSCIKYFKKENGGVSSARNLGLEKASGDYILFVDSDDYVAENYFSVIRNTLAEAQYHFVIFSAKYITGRITSNPLLPFVSEKPFFGNEATKKIVELSNAELLNSLLTGVFCRDIIEKHFLRFSEKLSIAEDKSFVLYYSMFVDTLQLIPDMLYCVDESKESGLSRKTRPDLTYSLLSAHQKMLEIVKSASFSPYKEKLFISAITWSFYRSAYSSCKELLKFSLNKNERHDCIRQICQEFSQHKIKPIGLKCWCIALPVRFRFANLIDFLIIHR